MPRETLGCLAAQSLAQWVCHSLLGSVRTAMRTAIFWPAGAAWAWGAAVAREVAAGEVGAGAEAEEPLVGGAEDPPPTVGAPQAARTGNDRVARPIDVSRALRVTITFKRSFSKTSGRNRTPVSASF